MSRPAAPPPSGPVPPEGVARRTALVAPAGVAACACLLGGCGGSEGESGGEGGAEVTVPSGDVPVGGGVIVDSVVVTQPTKGEYHAFDVTCPHQGCAVGEVGDRGIVCPCHGSTFDPSSGEPTGGPASSGLGRRTVTEDGDSLVVG